MVAWFSIMKAWDKGFFNVEFYKRLAKRVGWSFSYELVEREMLYYDTLYMFIKYFPVEVVYGGGSLVNRVYLTHAPRFSFDVDTTALEPVESKLNLLKSLLELNMWLEDNDFTLKLSFQSKELNIGEFMVDVEKDVFPDMISIKRIVPASCLGTPLSTYLKARLGVDITDREVSRKIIRLKSELGFMPRIEEIRIEVGFSRNGFQGLYSDMEVRSLLEPEHKPLKRLKCKISTLEYSIFTKIASLSRPYSDMLLPNMVRHLCDLRMLKLKYRKSVLRKLIEESELDIDEAIRNVVRVEKAGREIYEKSWHFTLLRKEYSWDKLCQAVLEKIRKLKT